MGAFKGAVKVGTHAIETDIHLSKDDVVVLSHVGDDTSNQGLTVADGRTGRHVKTMLWQRPKSARL